MTFARKILTSIPFLIISTVFVWGVGVAGSRYYGSVEWVNSARMIAALPILVLFNRRIFRFWGSEDIIPTYKLQDVGIHWKAGDNFNKAALKMNHYLQQLADGSAKRTGIVLTVIGVCYYFVAPYVA